MIEPAILIAMLLTIGTVLLVLLGTLFLPSVGLLRLAAKLVPSSERGRHREEWERDFEDLADSGARVLERRRWLAGLVFAGLRLRISERRILLVCDGLVYGSLLAIGMGVSGRPEGALGAGLFAAVAVSLMIAGVTEPVRFHYYVVFTVFGLALGLTDGLIDVWSDVRLYDFRTFGGALEVLNGSFYGVIFGVPVGLLVVLIDVSKTRNKTSIAGHQGVDSQVDRREADRCSR